MGKLLAWPLLIMHLLVGLFIALLIWPMMGGAAKTRTEQWFARRLMAILGVRVDVDFLDVSASPDPSKAKLYYSNHVSWLDIFAFNSVNPITFIAKSEIASWPLAGVLAKRSGTLFIERGKRHAVRDVIHKASECLKGGRDVAVFPEGTTGPGDQPMHFHSNFVQPAILAGAQLVPVSLQYRDAQGGFTQEPAYLGDQSLLENLQVLIGNWGQYSVSLTYHPPIDCNDRTRHDVSAEAYDLIAAGCGGARLQGDEASHSMEVAR